MILEPGVYAGLSFAEYAAIEAVNVSSLKGYARSPLHAHHGGHHESAAMSLGVALHCAVLEPDVYAARYVPAQRYKGPGERAINARAAARAEAAGLVELEKHEREQVENMRAALLGHPTAGPLIAGAVARELTVVWRDADTGALCKARWDLLTNEMRLGHRFAPEGSGCWQHGHTADHFCVLLCEHEEGGRPCRMPASDHEGRTVIGDLKTAKDASLRWFSKDVTNYGYHRAAAFYLAGAAALAPEVERGWLWLVVESEKPHGVAVYEPDDELLRAGADEWRAYLATHLACQESGVWPGYPVKVQRIAAPRWMR